MHSQKQVSATTPDVSKKATFKRALFRPEVQLLAFIVVLIGLGQVATFWHPMIWVLRAVMIGSLIVWMVGFLLLAALTPMPHPKDPPILIVRVRQLAKGIWAALMLVLSALLGASISADLLRYGTHNFQGFIKDVFVPGYLSLVIGLAFWGGMFIYMILTATDLLSAREPARTEARRRGLRRACCMNG